METPKQRYSSGILQVPWFVEAQIDVLLYMMSANRLSVWRPRESEQWHWGSTGRPGRWPSASQHWTGCAGLRATRLRKNTVLFFYFPQPTNFNKYTTVWTCNIATMWDTIRRGINTLHFYQKNLKGQITNVGVKVWVPSRLIQPS